MTYALDTNIISYILNGDTALSAKINYIAQRNEIIIPLIVYYEARRGLLANNAVSKLKSFNKLCVSLNIQNLTVADVDTAAGLYAERKRTGTTIEDADLLIAAQCVTNGYTLVTNNTKHFSGINGLLYETWK